ncbi:tRNA pseudouridine(13) synthase TruD [Thermosulfurimonas dismutans]|uniref:tRNA pseudouridine 13 synthase n=1 Tax=Thermosulfurimonas dismutans TaxID=999894 RepID=A0A179D6W5_9BACT|nr:tRNA pseudouridine(13) synthase TruD [Thermosulfurimonas dismutans]OAQ21796.1 tRNA pseudouridine 13 synthase [Thermosulfurimonas dismutans]
MHIKEIPEDFIVYEVADIHPEGQGNYALYRLKKRDLTTWDVLGEIARKLRRRQDEIGYGGLKDRHAVSYQFVTIPQGPKKDLHGEGWTLEYLGKVSSPMSKARLQGNLFEITVREVEASEEELSQEVEAVKRFGLPNYFDEQRFGSVRHGQGFAAREAVLGNYERALYLLLVEGSQYEYRRTEKFRECLRRNWPKVESCLELAPSPWERRLLEFLVAHKPSKRTFKRAFALIDAEYLLMLAHAYQAYLWNEILRRYLNRRNLDHFTVPYLLGEFAFYEKLSPEALEELSSLRLPLPSPRLKLTPDVRILYEEVLTREGIPALSKLRTLVKGLVFKTYPREAVIFPEGLTFSLQEDERHPGKKKAVFRYFLPKGSYATLVLKRIFRRGYF